MPQDLATESGLPQDPATERGLCNSGLAGFSQAQPPAGTAPSRLRDELVNAYFARYAVADKAAKARILDDFVARSGYHRKHAIRLLRQGVGRPRVRWFDEAVRDAVVAAWEASGRVGSRRVKELMPELVRDLEARGVLPKDLLLRGKLLAISPATIDRMVAPLRSSRSLERLSKCLTTISEAAAAIGSRPVPENLAPHERLRIEAVAAALLDDIRRLAARMPTFDPLDPEPPSSTTPPLARPASPASPSTPPK